MKAKRERLQPVERASWSDTVCRRRAALACPSSCSVSTPARFRPRRHKVQQLMPRGDVVFLNQEADTQGQLLPLAAQQVQPRRPMRLAVTVRTAGASSSTSSR